MWKSTIVGFAIAAAVAVSPSHAVDFQHTSSDEWIAKWYSMENVMNTGGFAISGGIDYFSEGSGGDVTHEIISTTKGLGVLDRTEIVLDDAHSGLGMGEDGVWDWEVKAIDTNDGNNMATTWVQAAVKFGFEIRLACPDEYAPLPDILAWARNLGCAVTATKDPLEAASGADCVVTDTWVSMGDAAADRRRKILAPYVVDDRLMATAKDDALFMHCLPAHRGEEVTDEVMDGPQSVIWDEAENRLHAQKGILAWCLGPVLGVE